MSIDCQEEAPGVLPSLCMFSLLDFFWVRRIAAASATGVPSQSGATVSFRKASDFSGGGLPGLGGLGNLGAPRDKSSFVRTCAGSESALETFFDSYSVFNSNIQFVFNSNIV